MTYGKSWAGLSLDRARIMGIVNVTPDSFSDGGQFHHVDAALEHGRRLAAEGADILDVGGESTRPGAAPVSREDELARVLPVVEGLAAEGYLVSIDTRHPEVMIEAAQVGAKIINDVSGFTTSPNSIATAVQLNLPVCLMHMQGTPETMQQSPRYVDAARDVANWLHAQADAMVEAGLSPDLICLDPGIGFGKTLEHNLSIMTHWSLYETRFPALLGVSRKSFIQKIMGEDDAAKRVPGSLIAAAAAYRQGCRLFRVHDVAPTVQALAVEDALIQASH